MRTLIYSFLMLAFLLAPMKLTAANSDQDRETAQTIANNMKKSGQLKDYRVGVKYHDGVAWLTGTVTNDEQKATAEKIAHRSAGVERIVSKLKISPERKAKDQPSETQRAKSKPIVAKQTVVDASVQPAINREATRGKMQHTMVNRRPMRPGQQSLARQSRRRGQPAARPRSRNNRPRPYARLGQDPRSAPRTRGGQAVRPVSYGGPALGAGGAMRAAGPMPAGPGQAVSYDNPQLPGYAWPSYAANPNYAALTYPKQYSPSAWPYIGPFYPYPQVPLGWRKVTLEWDDGWWFLDFKDK